MSSIPAAFPGWCGLCGVWYVEGTEIRKVAPSEFVEGKLEAHWVHAVCPDPLPHARAGEVICPDCFLIHPAGECW